MTERLNTSSLNSLPADVELPAYERSAVKPGIVHLGVGAFHRAHQAWYTERVLNGSGGDWGIVGASLRSADVAERLNPQDGLYTLVERVGNESRCRIIGALQAVMIAPDDPFALVSCLADPVIKVVTLTITEKGYWYNPESGGLAKDAEVVQRDIANFPNNPQTAIGFLVAGLALRCSNNAGGMTLLSCDNLPHNGRILDRVLKEFVAEVKPELLSWIEENVTFPCSMVDRIVPAVTDADLEALSANLGYSDRAAVFTEPFSQWVIEDKFANDAPDWQTAGALYTDDVSPFETMKLRLLNGSHSLMAYLGYLAGYEYVHQVIQDKHFNALVRQFMDHQVQPTLAIPAGFDIDTYKNQLCDRFANSALNHRLFQIAQDGSQKIPQRWLAPLSDLLALGMATEVLLLALAGWVRYVAGLRDSGEQFTVDDPLSETLKQVLLNSNNPLELLQVKKIFGDTFEGKPKILDAVHQYCQQIQSLGVKETVEAFVRR